MPEPRLDVITIGRSSVDLYGQQIGSRLEDIGSFTKAVGGCPANIAIGTARLGLKSALITRVGAEQMGGFIKEQMVREGVETQGIATDPDRLRLLNTAMSVWAQQTTGLPVDFQFQPMTEWRAEDGKPRNPLGNRWRTVHVDPDEARPGARAVGRPATKNGSTNP